MNDLAAPASTAPADAPVRAPLWHLGWTAGVVAAGAALLAGLGMLDWPALIALIFGAVPGAVGYFWRPVGRERLVMVGVWAAAAVFATACEGGVGGPLSGWFILPILAGALLGAPSEGLVMAAAALAVGVLLELAGVPRAAASGPLGVGLAVAGVLTTGGATAATLAILAGRARRRAELDEAKHAWLSGVMSELPHLALALDRDGRAEAVFGAPMPGLGLEHLSDGLVAAACEADRQHLRAALCDALDHGLGEAKFRPLAAPGQTLTVAFRRRAEDGLTALVREGGPTVQAEAAPQDLSGELDRSRAEARALERRLASAEEGRTRAYRSASDAVAATAAADTARAEAEANAVGKSRFLANMSHELRTPLNAIMGFSDIMRAKMFGELPGKYAEYAELIHESGRHLTDLINDVLDMSKIEAARYSLSREVFDAREAVNAALRLVRLQADEAGVQLRGVSPADALVVDADRRALKQIVLNLVSNALKFTPRGGSVTVTAQAAEGEFELTVADTGVGIAKEDLERLGRPFEQAGDADQRSLGTGLGLSLVKAFAGLHGGSMRIESALGEGAAVTVRLPVLATETEREPLVRPDWVDEAPAPGPMGEVIPLNRQR